MTVYTHMDDVPFRVAAIYRLLDKYGDPTEYPCCWIDCEVYGLPHSYLVASTLAQSDEWMDDDGIAYYATSEETIYEILKEIFGYEAEIVKK